MSIYDLPNWLIGVLIIGLTMAICVGGYLLFRRLTGDRPISDDQKGLALSVLSIVATVQSLLLAFSAVSVWESHAAAEESVVEEANTIGELARDLAVFGSPESMGARALLRAYARSVVDEEWVDLRRGEANDHAWQLIDDLFHAIGRMEPDNPRRAALQPEVWARANELIKLRRERLYTSQSEIPSTLWTVVIVGTLLTFMTTFVLPITRFNLAMISVVACSIGLVFFFLVAMDRPFAGQEGLSPGQFESTLSNMDRWDRGEGR